MPTHMHMLGESVIAGSGFGFTCQGVVIII